MRTYVHTKNVINYIRKNISNILTYVIQAMSWKILVFAVQILNKIHIYSSPSTYYIKLSTISVLLRANKYTIKIEAYFLLKIIFPKRMYNGITLYNT